MDAYFFFYLDISCSQIIFLFADINLHLGVLGGATGRTWP